MLFADSTAVRSSMKRPVSNYNYSMNMVALCRSVSTAVDYEKEGILLSQFRKKRIVNFASHDA